MRTEVLTVVLLKMQVFCDVTPFCWRSDSDVSKSKCSLEKSKKQRHIPKYSKSVKGTFC
jgi:hypothetical protein